MTTTSTFHTSSIESRSFCRAFANQNPFFSVHLGKFTSSGRYRLVTASTPRDAFITRACASTERAASTGGKDAAKLLNRKLAKTAALIRSPSSFAPFDRPNFNIALAVWKAVREIPEEERHQLLDRLDSPEIENLWTIAAQRLGAHPVDIQNALGPDFSLWDEFPEEAGEVFVYDGKAAVPAFGRFRKLFFLHPGTYELYGHVDVGWWPLGRALYPLYFRCSLEQSIFPGSNELTDLQLDYQPLEQLGLDKSALPASHGLPPPKQPRWPFSGNLRDYMRPVGPGVFVGRGWKHSNSLENGDPDAEKGSGFLYFVLARRREGAMSGLESS